jgi:superfamily I DNA and/or RNA helicase
MSDRDATDLNNVLTDAAIPDSTFANADGDEGASSSLAGAGNKIVTMGRGIRLATIDNFQGEEARIIILSLVRNPREQGAGIGFLAVDNRINVLLSR